MSWVAWNFDEWNTSRRLREMPWYPDGCQMIERTWHTRIDRSSWPPGLASLESPSHGPYLDAHVLRPAQSSVNWPEMRRLLGLLSHDILNWADVYREEYILGYEASEPTVQ